MSIGHSHTTAYAVRPCCAKIGVSQERQLPGRPRFGSVTVGGWNGSSGSGFPFRGLLCKKGFFCVSVQFNRKGQCRLLFLETVLVPPSVSGKTVPTVPVSGSVPEPP